MDFYLGRNRAFAQLGQATLNGSDTNVALATGHGSRLYPVTTASGLKVRAHIIERDPVTDAVIKCEIVNITNNVSDSLIIERAVEATRATDSTNTYAATPQTFTSNAYIEEIISVNVIKEITDDLNLRLPLAGGSMTGPLNLKAGTSIASAGSMDLSALTGNNADVTGTTTIVSLGGSSLPTGAIRELTFTGILTITHNATTLIMPNGGSNVITAAGDVFVFRHLGSGNWKCVRYTLVSGLPLYVAPITVSTPLLIDTIFPAGETLTISESLFVEPIIPSIDNILAQNIGDVSANTRFVLQGFGSGVSGSSMILNLAKVVSPSVNLNLRIESDNGSGSPSGTLVHANATATIAPGSLAAAPVLTDSTQTPTGSYNNSVSSTDWRGERILANIRIRVKSASTNGVAATHGRILTDAGVVLETVALVGSLATFTTQPEFAAGAYFRIEFSKNGVSYSVSRAGMSANAGTNITWTNTGSTNGAGSPGEMYNIINVVTAALLPEVSFSMAGSFTIPMGQKCHIILYPGTFGSETINGTNYYRI